MTDNLREYTVDINYKNRHITLIDTFIDDDITDEIKKGV